MLRSIDLEWLPQAIDDIDLGINLPNFELFLGYELSDVIKLYLNAFPLCMADWISDEVYCALGVAMDGRCWTVESCFR